MFDKALYMYEIDQSLRLIENIFLNCLESNLLKENIETSNFLVDSLFKVRQILNLKTDNYSIFFDKIKQFILKDKGCRYIMLLLLATPKENNYKISYENNFGLDYVIDYSDIKFIDCINDNFKFLILLRNEKTELPDIDILNYWSQYPIIKDKISVFYRLQDEQGKAISLQIMPYSDFTFDIYNLLKFSDIMKFISLLLKQNPELKDRINISFRKYLGNSFSLF